MAKIDSEFGVRWTTMRPFSVDCRLLTPRREGAPRAVRRSVFLRAESVVVEDTPHDLPLDCVLRLRTPGFAPLPLPQTDERDSENDDLAWVSI
jgi:hypothetical protein